MKYVFAFFCGKSVFFACAFFGIGAALAFMGKLTPTYVSMAAATQTLIVGRSIADDYHDRNKPKADGQ